MDYYEQFRFGSGSFATPEMIDAAGLPQEPEGLYLGQDQRGHVCFSNQQSALLLQGGARGFKSDHIIPWLIDGHHPHHVISMDWKGQNGEITQMQVPQGRNVVNWSPRDRGSVQTRRINATPYLRGDSPTLFPDSKIFSLNMIPFDGSKNGAYFQGNAQRINEAVTVTLARLKSSVVLPELADLMMSLGNLSDEWLGFEEHMAQMPEVSIRQVVDQLQEVRESVGSNAGGFDGIKGEITKAYSCMSDPQLRAATSPPFDWCFSELDKPDTPPTMVNIMESMEFAQTSAPVVKALYTAALIYKRRAVGSRPQIWLLDEIGNIGGWPMAVDLATFGAGYGIRPVYVVQSTAQLDNLAPRASQIIPNSCGTQIYKAVRDFNEARRLSSMLGTQTIEHEDFRLNETARIAQQNALTNVFMNGADPFEAGRTLAQQENSAVHKTKASREVLTPDEIMNMPQGNVLAFMPGTVARPMMLTVPHYWQRPELAGRYLRDPFHSPQGAVEVNNGRSQIFAPIITEPVPPQLADKPQYASGQWSYVQGYRPL